MANFLEKALPKRLRNRTSELISGALVLFLALQYNETINVIFTTLFPVDTTTLIGRIIYVLVLTVAIVYIIVLIEEALDGK